MKFIVTALAVCGLAYLMMMYFGSLWQKVAFTTAITGQVSYAVCILGAFGVIFLAKLTWK